MHRTTLQNLLVVVLVVAFLDCVPVIHDVCQTTYTRFHSAASHRLAEATVATLGFIASTAFLQIFALCGVRQFTTSLKRTEREASVSTAAQLKVRSAVDGTTALFEKSLAAERPQVFGSAGSTTGVGDFAFWAIAAAGLYMSGIDLSQRASGDTFDWMHYADPTFPSFTRIALEVIVSVWAYDFLFYFVHRSFHATYPIDKSSAHGKILSWWRGLHLAHHDHYKNTHIPLFTMTTFHHHIIDVALQVGINIFVQQIPFFYFLFPGPRHRVSKFVHNLAVTYLLVEAHSGYDLPFMSHRLFPSVFGGSVRHQIHHQTGKHYFHQFFMYLDDWYAERLAASP